MSGPKVKTSAARSNISVIGVKANVEKPQSKIKQPNKVKMAGILGAQPTRTQIIKKKIAIRQIRLR